jgi:phosphoribosylanthranilate isomerase
MRIMVQAKICGLSTPGAVDAALAGRAAFLGFVFFGKSPRDVAPELAARLAEPARGKARVVALVVDPTDAEVERIVVGLKPDLLQLHGRETPARTAEIGRLAALPLIKALPVSEARDLDAARAYEPIVERLMFDAKPPTDADRPGGLGARFDWTLMAGRRFERPWFLAGGLDPWNVADAVAASGAPMVDVSSGVERGPGLKDAALIGAFLDAARKA